MYGPGGRWGGGGAAGPPQIFEPLFLGGSKRKFGRSQFLKTYLCFCFNYYYFFMFDVFFIFIIILLFFMFLKFYPEVGVIFQLHPHETVVV